MTAKQVCARCGRQIECCTVCEDGTCENLSCYRCLLYDLDEARPVEPRDES